MLITINDPFARTRNVITLLWMIGLQSTDKHSGIKRIDIIKIHMNRNEKLCMTALRKQNCFPAVKIADDVLFIAAVVISPVDRQDHDVRSCNSLLQAIPKTAVARMINGDCIRTGTKCDIESALTAISVFIGMEFLMSGRNIPDRDIIAKRHSSIVSECGDPFCGHTDVPQARRNTRRSVKLHVIIHGKNGAYGIRIGVIRVIVCAKYRIDKIQFPGVDRRIIPPLPRNRFCRKVAVNVICQIPVDQNGCIPVTDQKTDLPKIIQRSLCLRTYRTENRLLCQH